MKRKLTIVVTSGGTDVHIDDVRKITNFSKWTTWALLTEWLVKEWNTVTYMHASNAKLPFMKNLQADPHKNIDEELERIRKQLLTYQDIKDNLSLVAVNSFDEYHKKLLKQVQNPSTEVVILCMAASDFWVKQKVKGKISSDTSSLNIELSPLPRIIDEVKKQRRDIMLVGFKFLLWVDADVLIEKAYKSMLRNWQNICVANVAESNWLKNLRTYIITIEKGIIPVQDRTKLPEILHQQIQERFSKDFFTTNYTSINKLPVPQEEIDKTVNEIKKLSKLALFEPYHEDYKADFWFLAKRSSQWTLITGRWSSKSECSEKELALITNLDTTKRIIDVVSKKKKASLNGAIAHMIFEQLPKSQYIVHSHISLPNAYKIKRNTTPWTIEDLQIVQSAVMDGHKIIEQENHGVIIILNELNELYDILRKNNIYNNESKYYDLAYARFQENKRFIDTIKENINTDSNILDMCAGTWDVTQQLLKIWYTNVHLADWSTNMLDIAKNKIENANLSFTEQNLLQPYKNKHNAIVIRQAINYIPNDDLERCFQYIYDALENKGKFIFNTFLADKEKEFENKQYSSTVWVHKIINYEGNLINWNTLYHWQKSHIFNTETGDYKHVYDMNSFDIHSEDQLLENLLKVNFSVNIIREKRSLYFVCEKLI